MARRNRKNEQRGNRFAVWGIGIITILAVMMGLYLRLCSTCEQLGRKIKEQEYLRAEMHKQVVNEQRNWSMACSIINMERMLAAQGIAMTFPAQKNIIRLKPLEPADPLQYAQRNSARD